MKIVKNLNHFFPTHLLKNIGSRVIVYVKNDNPEIFVKIIKTLFNASSPSFKNNKMITFYIKYNSVKEKYYKENACFCDSPHFDQFVSMKDDYVKAFKASEFEEIAQILVESMNKK